MRVPEYVAEVVHSHAFIGYTCAASNAEEVRVLPTYEYRCGSCSHQFERFQKMSDDPVRECELCGEGVERVLFPVAVHFKGSGFYTTDYARKKTLPASSKDSDKPKSDECASCPSKDTNACAASS